MTAGSSGPGAGALARALRDHAEAAARAAPARVASRRNSRRLRVIAFSNPPPRLIPLLGWLGLELRPLPGDRVQPLAPAARWAPEQLAQLVGQAAHLLRRPRRRLLGRLRRRRCRRLAGWARRNPGRRRARQPVGITPVHLIAVTAVHRDQHL